MTAASGRLALVHHSVGAILLAAFAGQLLWLWLLRGQRILHSETILIAGQLLLGSALLAVVCLPRTGALPRSSWPVLLGAAILQLSAVVLVSPSLSDDLVRYRLDGLITLSGQSPYARTPASFLAGQSPSTDSIDHLVPHSHTRSIYSPVAQAIFALTRAAEHWLIGPPPGLDSAADTHSWRAHAPNLPLRYRALVHRLLFAAMAVAGSAVLLHLVQRRGIGPWIVAVFAWSPLLVMETGGNGHIDIAGVLLLLAIDAGDRGRFGRAGALLALACGVKPHVIILLPWLARPADGANRRHPSIALASFGLTLCLVYSPLLWQKGYVGWLQSLRNYSAHWEANGSIYVLFKAAIAAGQDGPAMTAAKASAKVFAAIAVLGVAVALWRRGASTPQAVYWVMLVMLLTAPVAYPWYLLWALAIVPLLQAERSSIPQGLTALVWAGSIAISYRLWHHMETWTHLPADQRWVLTGLESLAQYIPVYVALVLELAGRFRARQAAPTAALTEPSGSGAPADGRRS